jgi:hypothetical protein
MFHGTLNIPFGTLTVFCLYFDKVFFSTVQCAITEQLCRIEQYSIKCSWCIHCITFYYVRRKYNLFVSYKMICFVTQHIYILTVYQSCLCVKLLTVLKSGLRDGSCITPTRDLSLLWIVAVFIKQRETNEIFENSHLSIVTLQKWENIKLERIYF